MFLNTKGVGPVHWYHLRFLEKKPKPKNYLKLINFTVFVGYSRKGFKDQFLSMYLVLCRFFFAYWTISRKIILAIVTKYFTSSAIAQKASHKSRHAKSEIFKHPRSSTVLSHSKFFPLYGRVTQRQNPPSSLKIKLIYRRPEWYNRY